MLFVEAGAWFQELVSKVLPKSKVDLFYGTDCLVIVHIYIIELLPYCTNVTKVCRNSILYYYFFNKLQCNETLVAKGYCSYCC